MPNDWRAVLNDTVHVKDIKIAFHEHAQASLHSILSTDEHV
jgi:hypothetical protein